ncbi:MAG TPA: hypothetical protein VM659_28655 [Dongiaceae bacterium]|nr:hypothetical protein [Dongiaceae bacterium]
MARIRSIHPGTFTDESFVTLSSDAQVFLIGLWTEADDQGIFEWKPLTLRLKLRPTKDGDVSELLAQIEAVNAIKSFTIEGRKYGAIRNFRKYQKPKSPNSTHPTTPEIRIYVCLDKPISETSKPQQEQFPQKGETALLMEDGGDKGKREEIQSPLPPSPKLNTGREWSDGGRGMVEPDPNDKDFVQVISAFDRERVLTFGPKQARPFIHGSDATQARKYLAAGADLMLCREVFQAGFQQAKAQNETIPGTLKYFETRIANAIATAAKPMKAGSASAGDRQSRPQTVSGPDDFTWQLRIETFRAKGTWNAIWGAKPNEPGCLAPKHLLEGKTDAA